MRCWLMQQMTLLSSSGSKEINKVLGGLAGIQATIGKQHAEDGISRTQAHPPHPVSVKNREFLEIWHLNFSKFEVVRMTPCT